MQKILRKMINEMSVAWLLLLVGSLYFIWTVGLNNNTALFLYENSSQLILGGIAVLFLLNVYKARGIDFIFIGIGFLFFFFFSYFREVRSASFYTDMMIPLIIAFVLSIKWIEFGKIDRAVFLLLFSVVLTVTVYRVFTEIPIREGQSIWSPGNKLSDIWINTNTIGASVMTLAFLISGFASSFEKWYIRLLSVPAVVAAFATIWVCQSRGALVALIVFILLDLIPKSFMRVTRAPFIIYTVTAVAALPLSYFAAASKEVNLFTGREEIWADFYQTLAAKTQQVLVGMKPYFYTKRANQVLGNHNSYNSFLNLYGVIGLAIVVTLLLIFIGRRTLKGDLSNGQLTFIWAFFGIMTQSFMEDTLTSFAWLPIIYLLLGMSVHRFDQPAEMQKVPDELETADESFENPEENHNEFSRMKKYHH